jgi:hypothetical protein
MRSRLEIVLVAILAATGALADDGVFCGAGGAVELSSSSHVRMVAEEVVFDCTDPKLAHVSCLFRRRQRRTGRHAPHRLPRLLAQHAG